MPSDTMHGYCISPIQRRIWALMDSNPERQYFLYARVRVEGRLLKDLLSQSIATVVQRHEALRTTLHFERGMPEPLQVVGDGAGIALAEAPAAADWWDPASPDVFDPGTPFKIRMRKLGGQEHCIEVLSPAFCVDFESLSRIIQEIAENYRALAGGTSVSSALPLQYPDVTEWLIELLQSKEAASGRKYWRDLGNAAGSELLALADASCNESSSSHIKVNLPDGIAGQILAQEHLGRWKATDYLLTAWSIVLQRLGYKAEYIAVNVNSRSEEALHGAIGPLTRYLPVSLNVRSETPLLRCIEETRTALRKAENLQQCFSWEILAGEAGAPSHFRFAFDHIALEKFQAGPELSFTVEDISGNLDQFGICLSCRQSSQKLELQIHWNSHLFTSDEVNTVAHGLAVVLAGGMAQPETPVSALDITDLSFKEWLAGVHDREARDLSDVPWIHQQFFAQAEKTPQAVAVVHGADSLTYSELSRKASKVASALRHYGVRPESLVGIFTERSVETIVAILGVLRAGGAFVPLDPGSSEERLCSVINNSRLSLILTGVSFVHAELTPNVQVFQTAALEQQDNDARDFPTAIDGNNPACVIYNSGYWRHPVGVIVTHHGLRNNLESMTRNFPLDSGERVLQNLDFNHERSVPEIFAPLVCGSTLVLDHPHLAEEDGRRKIDINPNPKLPAPPAFNPARAIRKLSYHQERMWFIDRFETGVVYRGSPVYHNIPVVVRLSEVVDAELLEQSLNEVVMRHAALRTTLVQAEGKAVQKVQARLWVELERRREAIDCQDEQQVLGMVQELADEPFVLEGGTLVRATLVETGGENVGKAMLVVVAHHSIVDRFSMRCLVREMAEIYGAQQRGEAAELPAVGIEYPDYGEWQREVKEEVWEEYWLYWKSQKLNERVDLELPWKCGRHAVHVYRSGAREFVIGGEVTRGLEELCRRQQISREEALLGCFYVLLHLYSGQQEFLVGVPERNRGVAGTERTIGAFSNLVVAGGRPQGKKLVEWVKEMAWKLREGRKYGELPFDLLVQKVKPVPDMSRTALFDVLFDYEERGGERLGFGGVSGEVVESNLGYGKYDLNLLMEDRGEKLKGHLIYNQELYEGWLVEQMAGHYKAVVEELVRGGQQRVEEVRVLSGEERRRQLESWNETGAEYEGDKTLVDLFLEQVEACGERVAVSCGKEELRYAELNERAEKVAEVLRGEGVGADTLVGICVERSVGLVVAVLGVLKAGGGYVPMDPVYPEERLRFMVKDAGVKYVIAGEGERERFVGASGAGGEGGAAEGRGEGGESRAMEPVECCVVVNAGGGVEQVWEVEGSGGKQRVWGGQEKKEKKEKGKGKEEGGGGVSGPGNLAYCIYTSGSTGQPNGVLVEQRQVVRLMKNSGFAFAVSAEDVWTLFHSYCFDFSVWEIWGALLYGGRLVVVPREVTRDPGALVKLLREEKVTVLNQTPASFYNVAREAVEQQKQQQQKQRGEKKGEQGEDLDLALRYVIFGGEALQPAYLKPWKEAYPEVKLVNMYGITETTVHVTVREVQERDIEQGRSNIGVPIATTRTYILNAEMEPVPVGVTGEIYVGGEGLARGYAGRAGLTAERFVPDPLGGEAGGRLYRTGDLARYGADGTMEYRGRMDHQVKVRGYRIELGEIEAALLGQGGVSRAVVVLRESGAEKQLVGYVVGDGRKGKLDLNELRQGIREKLPSYMVPGAMVELDALPLTSNGKVDRKALPHPENLSASQRDAVPRSNPHWYPDQQDLLRAIEENKITIVQLVREQLRGMLREEQLEKCRSLKWVYCADESPGLEVIQDFYRRMPWARLCLMHGAPEAAYGGSVEAKQTDGALTWKMGSNIRIFILDKAMNLVPVGVKGEMYVAGRDLARGYLQRPEFTAQMFVPNPFSTVPGDRLFKTNRQARWRKDGTIDDLGSLTGGITLWGNRLSLQQMREALLESRYVKDAVITLKPGLDGEPRLAGYIIPGETADDLNADLRQHLGSIFPEYMIPDKFIALEKFPLAPDGSVDVHALPLPEHDAADSEALLRDEIEIRLAAIWKDLLKISRAGRTQSFFELGGHSLLAITLIRKIKEEFNQDLPLSTLFEHATIEYLGNVLRQKHQASRTSNLVPIQPKGTRPPLFFVHPLSGNALQYLTLANLLGKDQPFYGLQSVDEEENSCQPYLSIEERASRYIHAVQKIQPTGPYFIGGWSFGGYIAYEMAQQLHSQNHEVAGLILLDIIAHTPEQETRVPDDAEFLLHFASSNRLRFATIDRQMEQSLAGLTLDAVRNQKPADRLRYLIDQLVNIGVLPPETEISQIQQFIQSVRKREKSLTCYKLHSYGGPVTLVRAAETNPTHSELDPADTSLGFSQLCPGLKVQFSPGNHFNMVYPPHVTGLAQIVKEWIEASSAVLV